MHSVICLTRPISFEYFQIIGSDLFNDDYDDYDEITYDENDEHDKFIACILLGAERP